MKEREKLDNLGKRNGAKHFQKQKRKEMELRKLIACGEI